VAQCQRQQQQKQVKSLSSTHDDDDDDGDDDGGGRELRFGNILIAMGADVGLGSKEGIFFFLFFFKICIEQGGFTRDF
jgi:hypothetical protein